MHTMMLGYPKQLLVKRLRKLVRNTREIYWETIQKEIGIVLLPKQYQQLKHSLS